MRPAARCAGEGSRPVAQGPGPLARDGRRRRIAAPRLGPQRVRINERADYRALVVLLAGRLYRHDHGADPPSDEALVGPYLKSLPDDGLGDMGEVTRESGANGRGARE